MNRLKTGVMGCTGLVGQQFVRMLEDHPFFEVVALTASRQSAGEKYEDAVDWLLEDYIHEYTRNRKFF